jgi:hypothetical protein
MYHITEYTFKKARDIGVTVKPSTSKGKKIDVYKDGKKIGSVGAVGYKDYPMFLKQEGIEHANKRRELYKQRHEKDRHIKWSKGWLADQLLW